MPPPGLTRSSEPVPGKLDRMGRGFWITRTPDIRKDEWRAFVKKRSDLRSPDESFGEMPDGLEARPNLPEFVWWMAGIPSKVLFSKGTIFIEAEGAEAAAFARSVAEHFGGDVQEG
jgi:hypothetical protein